MMMMMHDDDGGGDYDDDGGGGGYYVGGDDGGDYVDENDDSPSHQLRIPHVGGVRTEIFDISSRSGTLIRLTHDHVLKQ